MPEYLEAASAWFEAYYRSQADDAPEDAVHLELKRLHCRKVMDEAAALAESLDLSPRLGELAAVAGLCHDVGRFPQYRRYKTFSDPQSVNHARLGTATLARHGGLGELPRRDRTLVRTAIVVHNRRLLPAALLAGGDPEALTLARILRDADKLDIVRVMLDHFRAEGPKDDVVFLGQPDTGRYTPVMIDDILAGKLGSYENMASATDFALLVLSWINDMAYPWTRHQFFARGHVQGLFDQLPDAPVLAALRTWYFERHAPKAS
jgi:HD superfamily phosphohydrolase YqeK